MDGMYFVVSDGDAPEAIYFNDEDAFGSGFQFIDVFDDEGNKVVSYKLDNNVEYGQETCEDDYTTIF